VGSILLYHTEEESMLRNVITVALVLAVGVGAARAALSPAVPGGPQLSRPSPRTSRIGGRAYNAANVLVGGARVEATALLRGDRCLLPPRGFL
jgi:hypothetical protein